MQITCSDKIFHQNGQAVNSGGSVTWKGQVQIQHSPIILTLKNFLIFEIIGEEGTSSTPPNLFDA